MYSIDNERPDIQRAYWRDQDTIWENYYNNFHREIPIAEFAETEEGAIKISEIVRSLVRRGGGRCLTGKENVFFDVDWAELNELITCEAIIPDGWDYPLTDSDDINIHLHGTGNSDIEILVEIFDPQPE